MMKWVTVIAILFMVGLTTGCATSYEMSRSDGQTNTNVSVKSYREFPGGVKVDYNREAGAFALEAGEVNDSSADVATATMATLLQMIIMNQMGMSPDMVQPQNHTLPDRQPGRRMYRPIADIKACTPFTQ